MTRYSSWWGGRCRRTLATVLAYSAIGVILTLSCVLTRCLFPLDHRARLRATIVRHPDLVWPVQLPEGWPSAPTRSSCRDFIAWTECRFDDGDPFGYALLETRIGFPIRAMRWYVLVAPRPAGQYPRQSLELVGGLTAGRSIGGSDITLPVHSLPLGMAADIASWGGAAWAVRMAVLLAIQRLRRRSNRCECCGYGREGLPRAVSQCPECGRPIIHAAK